MLLPSLALLWKSALSPQCGMALIWGTFRWLLRMPVVLATAMRLHVQSPASNSRAMLCLRLPRANVESWPMGDVTPKQPPPDGIDPVKLQPVVDQVFSDPAGQTLAFVLVYKGQIIAERYGHGANRDTLIEGWSMGKSLLAALIGVLIKDGEFGLYDPAPVPEWQRPGDEHSDCRSVANERRFALNCATRYRFLTGCLSR